jgi:hypothetical protein
MTGDMLTSLVKVWDERADAIRHRDELNAAHKG